MFHSYFYALIYRYVALYVTAKDTLTEYVMVHGPFPAGCKRYIRYVWSGAGYARHTVKGSATDAKQAPDYVLLNGVLHYERDIQGFLLALREQFSDDSRLLLVYYSSLWKPLIRLASTLRIRKKQPEMNWLAHDDVHNLLRLANYEPVYLEHRILIPVYVPLLSFLVNKYVAPLPLIRSLALINVLVARKCLLADRLRPSVSVVIPARNEAGNLAELVGRVPQMGLNDELIFVEGHSTDNTWDVIQGIYAQRDSRRMQITQQDGKGKGDAVRKGFSLATGDVLMILDSDLSVDPEELSKFYDAIRSGKGEFINGSRLVYPMEKRAMRFLNMLANKFFAIAFSFVLGQRLKDTLCGTKVVSRRHYERIAQHRSYFGDFDPFGDFDLLFGAARLGLKIIEVPVAYKERTYGRTNISRFHHGALLFRMLFFALMKFKFI